MKPTLDKVKLMSLRSRITSALSLLQEAEEALEMDNSATPDFSELFCDIADDLEAGHETACELSDETFTE